MVLVVSDQSFSAFREADVRSAALQIEQWLCSVDSAFADTGASQRRGLAERMLDLAVRYEFETERDIRLFCYGCWRLGPDWYQRLTTGETGAWLADPQFNPESKLLHIDSLLAETGAVR
jgi:hypothetical protein